MLFNFSEFRIAINRPELAGDWTTLIYSADAEWRGPETNLPVDFKLASPGELPLAPHSFLVLQQSSFAEETA